MERSRTRAVVSGRVQGVGFRMATQAEAERRGLVGWVRNLDDGRVEFEAEGELGAVDALVAWAHEGPGAARVDGVDAASVALAGGEGFVVRH